MQLLTADSRTVSLILALGAIGVSLAVGSIARWIALRNAGADLRRQRFGSLRTWWLLYLAATLALLAGRPGVVLAMATTSLLALHEYHRLILDSGTPRAVRSVSHAVAVGFYLIVLLAVVLTAPAAVALGSAAVLITAGHTHGYVRTVAGLSWGHLVLVVGLSHVALLHALPGTADGPLGTAGWCLYIVLLTEVNDIAQAVVGRRFGRHKRHRLSPAVSPNKTWEGWLGAAAITTTVAVVSASWLTTLGESDLALTDALPVPGAVAPMLAAAIVVVLGLLGDLNMSAVKRDVGVKDSGTLLPGMGGMIDRVDSLSFTAPAFFWLACWQLG